MLLGRCGRTCHRGLPDCLILPSISSSFQARQTAYNPVLMMERPFSRIGNLMQFHEGIAATLPQKDLGMILNNWPYTLFHSLEV
ncbi:unnamed protein product [Sphagnum jensenii]